MEQSDYVTWRAFAPRSTSTNSLSAISRTITSKFFNFDILDAEVEYREFVYKRSVGPVLLRSVSDFNTTVDVRGPLTPALGLSPSRPLTGPMPRATMALYFAAEGGNSDKVLGLTCQHVLLETDGSTNDDYVFAGTGAPRNTSSCSAVSRHSHLRQISRPHQDTYWSSRYNG